MSKMATRTPIIDRQIFAENLAADAGALAKQYFCCQEDLEIESKNLRDFVSEADRCVETMIRKRLAEDYPGEDIVGEEGGGVETDAYWSIDPIDGTSNFLAGIPLWGVSIAFCENKVPTVGAISIPMLDILVSANVTVDGVRLNRQLASNRNTSPIPTISIGQSPYWETSSFRLAEDILRDAGLECMIYRCSVVSIVFASLGFTHGYYEEHTNMWDVAAGVVIARQSGLNADIIFTDSSSALTICILTDELQVSMADKLAQKRMETNKNS